MFQAWRRLGTGEEYESRAEVGDETDANHNITFHDEVSRGKHDFILSRWNVTENLFSWLPDFNGALSQENLPSGIATR